MTAHKHAENMLQYAQDAMETNTPWELWEWRRVNSTGPWDELEANPTWCKYNEYRRKTRTININGHKVPEPLRWPLKYGDKYFAPAIGVLYLATKYHWRDDVIDNRLLERGLVHRTEKAAIAHAKALLSFTTGKNEDV